MAETNKRIGRVDSSQLKRLKSFLQIKHLFEAVSDAIEEAIIIHTDTVVLYANRAAHKMVGVDQSSLTGQPFAKFILKDHLNVVSDWIHCMYSEDRKIDPRLEIKCIRDDGSLFDIEVISRLLTWNKQKVVLSLARDRTNLNNLQTEYNRTQNLLEKIIDNLEVGIWSVDVFRDQIITASKPVSNIYGVDLGEFLENRNFWQEVIHPDDKERVKKAQNKLNSGVLRHQYRIIHQESSEIRYIEDLTVPVLNENKELIRLDGIVIDITKQKHDEEQLQHLAYHDDLTGLLNRKSLEKKLAAMQEDVERNVLLLYVDLDRFGRINDTLGYETGDILLQEVAERLKTIVGEQGFAARMGGDDFAIVISNINEKEINSFINELSKELKREILVKEMNIYITASIGGAIYAKDTENYQELLNHAEIAQISAKKMTDYYVLYNKDMSQLKSNIILESSLRTAVERDEFELYYQPQYKIKTGELIGAEALIRWNHPTLGHLGPNEFIAIAEESGLIEEIGRWVIHNVCYQIKYWKEERYPVVPVSINLSVRQFYSKNLISDIKGILAETQIASELLGFEITESIAIDFKVANSVLEELRNIGIGISVDDFGTGYSSLAYLSKMPISCLKIDRSFINNLGSKDGNSIVKAIITLAKGLDLKVVAEGVETAEQKVELEELGCDFVQGYFYSKPLSVSVFERSILYENF
ncbi:sensor domain-containing protein [Paenibacillus illinoisensis]|uniref:Diguanylate cyclase n=1 Tax=Paenibacillus illinoisensis TaxID=59845 RepID=A0A2W0CNA2_9BACL|nr:EAL domain-containing protein [Paenibacillus illinoisensis]PYY29665.1 Diguanylate cyclase [Paenibacillus illinoisensis]